MTVVHDTFVITTVRFKLNMNCADTLGANKIFLCKFMYHLLQFGKDHHHEIKSIIYLYIHVVPKN